MKKQFLSLLLALLMVFTLLPVQVWAVEGEGITSPQESQEEVVDPVSQLPKLTVSEDEDPVTPEDETPQAPQPEKEPTQDKPPVEETENDQSADLLDAANAAVAGSGECGNNLTWKLTSDGTLTISGTGTMYNYSLFGTPWYNLTVKSVIITSDVTTIGNYAFASCRSLITVSLPETLRTIGNSAFFHCSALKSIALPDSIKYIGTSAFSGCVNLSSVALGTGCKNINGLVFESCSNLEEINIPEGVETIEYSAFENCTNLQKVMVPASITSIDANAFQNCPCLSDVYYNAYGEDWGYITGEDEAFSYSVTIHYKDNIYGSGWCGDNAEWLLKDGVLTISGSGAMYDYGYDYGAPWANVSSLVKEVVIENGITTIGESAFEYCENLTSVTISQSVYSIGDRAFDSCRFLRDISLPADLVEIGASAFWGCTALSEIILPTKLRTIGSFAFMQCQSLSTLDIPASVREIGEGATFVLNAINVDSQNRVYRSVDGVLFSNDGSSLLSFPRQKGETYRIPDGVVTVAASAFSFNSRLSNIICPKSLKEIEVVAFFSCTSLSKITFSSGLESIDTWAFSCCSSLKEISFENCAADIAFGAFADCNNLSSVDFGNRLRSIGEEAFKGTSLQTVTIPNSVTSIGAFAFANCTSLTSAKLPSSVTEIAYGSFAKCRSLSSVDIPSGVKTIGNSAFANCSALTSISLPGSVTSIVYFAFGNCSALRDVYIPKSVTRIENYAFIECNDIVDVYYGGQKNQWDSLSIDENNLPLLYATIHYATNGLQLNITNYDTIGSDNITVRLTKGSNNYPASIASNGQYSFDDNIPAGVYTLSVEKPGYVTYQQEVNYDGSGGLLPSIRLLRPGDINQSGGEADAIDMQRLYEYLTGSYTITDPYLLKVADVNGDGTADVYDLQLLYEAVSGISKL